MRKRRDEKVLPAVRPNVGIEIWYRKKLLRLAEEMSNSVEYWLKASYRKNEPVMAQDETPAVQLRIAVNKLVRYWQRRFDDASKELAKYFALAANKRSDAALRSILKKNGWSVKFTVTPEMRDVMKAAIAENVALIRSIPQQYLTNVAGEVYRSVQAGRDLGTLAKQLEKQYGVTRRRAALISRDQNNKMTATFTRVRQQEIGVECAIWMHSHAGKVARRTHLANDGNRYKVAEGWFDPDPKVRRYIYPGELISCRCTSRSIVKGFS